MLVKSVQRRNMDMKCSQERSKTAKYVFLPCETERLYFSFNRLFILVSNSSPMFRNQCSLFIVFSSKHLAMNTLSDFRHRKALYPPSCQCSLELVSSGHFAGVLRGFCVHFDAF